MGEYREFKVYLAGPITGLTFEGCSSWREYAKEKLWRPTAEQVATAPDRTYVMHPGTEPARPSVHWNGGSGIVGYSPLRAKDYLLERGILSGHPDAYNDQVLSSAKGILQRDHWDVQTCDMLLVNLLGAETVSIGTVLEIGFGHAYRKPMVVAMEPDNIHVHAMLTEAVGWIADDLDFAIDLVRAILLPDGIKVRQN